MNWLDQEIMATCEWAANNPLFVMKSQRLGWPSTIREFRRYRGILLAVGCVLEIFWLILGGTDASGSLMYFLLLLNLGLILAADLYAGLISITSIQRMIATGTWDELRLTNLSVEDILKAEHAIAALRGWRVTILQVVGRYMMILAPALALFSYTFEHTPTGVFLFVLAPLLLIYGVLTYPLWRLFCVHEPAWALEEITRQSITIAERFPNPTLAFLVGFAAVLLFRVSEPFITLISLVIRLVRT